MNSYIIRVADRPGMGYETVFANGISGQAVVDTLRKQRPGCIIGSVYLLTEVDWK